MNIFKCLLIYFIVYYYKHIFHKLYNNKMFNKEGLSNAQQNFCLFVNIVFNYLSIAVLCDRRKNSIRHSSIIVQECSTFPTLYTKSVIYYFALRRKETRILVPDGENMPNFYNMVAHYYWTSTTVVRWYDISVLLHRSDILLFEYYFSMNLHRILFPFQPI